MTDRDNVLWLQCWRDQRADFNQKTVNLLLIKFWTSLDLVLGSWVFVRLCGRRITCASSYDRSVDSPCVNMDGSVYYAEITSHKLLRALIAIMILISGLQTATQIFAFEFQYHRLLGFNVFHIYPPWAIVGWTVNWAETYPSYLLRAGNVAIIVTGVGLLLQTIVILVFDNSAKANLYLRRSARWANLKDLSLAGLLPRPRSFSEWLAGVKRPKSTSVFVGAWLDKQGHSHYLRHSGGEHVLSIAPSGSGKVVGLIIPTLTTWAHSAVITDLKGELWGATAGWRQQHANNVFRFEPTATEIMDWTSRH